MSTTPAPRKRLPRAEREALMLDAAEEVFGTIGFRAASMDDIARRSGVTKALLYQYFSSKEGIYDACMERVRGRLFDTLEADLQALAPQQRLRAFIDRYFTFLEEHRDREWILYGETSSGTANAMRELNAEAIGRMLRDAMAAFGGRHEQDLHVTAHALVGAGEQVGRWWLEQPQISRDDVADRFEAVAVAIITGLAQRPR